jgi:hypothetical protein
VRNSRKGNKLNEVSLTKTERNSPPGILGKRGAAFFKVRCVVKAYSAYFGSEVDLADSLETSLPPKETS